MVNQMLNVQPEVDTHYIAGIQQKSIPEEHRFIANIESNLIQLKYDVEYYKAKSLKFLENNVVVVPGSYESVDARGKKEQKISLKRKWEKKYQLDTSPKKAYSQIADSAAGREDEMKIEYCNAVDNVIVVHSRDSELTLRPRNQLLRGPRSTPNSENIVYTNQPNSSIVSPANKVCSATKKTSDSSGFPGSNGDGDESDEDNRENVVAVTDTPQISIYEENWKKLQEFKRKFQEEWKLDKRKFVVEHLEHAYNECLAVSGTESCQLATCYGLQTKSYCDETIDKVVTAAHVDDASLSTLLALLYHSMMCTNKINCNLPLCSDFMKSIRDWFEEQLDDVSTNGRASLTFGNEQPKLLFSTVGESFIGEASRNNLLCDFRVNHAKFLGKGGFGKVYDSWVVYNKKESRMAVKKMVPNDGQGVNIYVVVANLECIRNGPNLLIPDLVISSGRLTYLVMEKGEICLLTYLKKVLEVHKRSCDKEDHIGPCNSGLPVQTCSLYFLQMARALDYLHDCGFTHGDVKSENVMIMPGFQQVKLIDFDTLKRESVIERSGTHGYAAPEVYVEGNVTKASDVFSLCSIIPDLYYAFDMRYSEASRRANHVLKFVSDRNNAICRWMERLDRPLALIFQQGTQVAASQRPSIKKLIQCFQENDALRERAFSNISIPPLTNVTVSTDPDPSPDCGRVGTNLDRRAAVCKQVLEKWLDNIMSNLPARFPKKWPVENSYEERFEVLSAVGDRKMIENVDLEDILNKSAE